MRSVVITGASSGLGERLAYMMAQSGLWRVYNFSPEYPTGRAETSHPQVTWLEGDVRDYPSLERAAAYIRDKDPDQFISVLVNCAAINRINYLEDVSMKEWAEVMDTNARGMMYTAQAFLDHLKIMQGTICNIVSDAAHKPMTGSLAYNASKGAAHIMTLQLARELTRRHGICVFGVAPGKLGKTGMSDYIDRRVTEMRGWTPEEASAYAQAGRLWPEEINVDVLADFLTFILSSPQRHRYFSGCVIPYGA